MKLSDDLLEMAKSISKCFSEATPLSSARDRKTNIPSECKAIISKLEGLGLKEVLLDSDFTEGHQLLGVVARAQGEMLLPIPFASILWGEMVCEKAGHKIDLAGIIIEETPTANYFVRFIPGRQNFLHISKSGAKVCSYEKISPKSSIDFTQYVCSLDGNLKTICEIPSIDAYSEFALRARELGGAASNVLTMTLDYVKTRNQFGVPIGSFQAVQHALASCQVMVEGMESLSQFACWTLDKDSSQTSLVAPSSLQFAAKSSPESIEKCLQMSGGIGFTWEHDLHLFLRRAKFLEGLSGDLSSEVLSAVA